MHILITGGSGFLGARLARTLLKQSSLSLRGAPARAIERITLTDRAPPPGDLLGDPRVRHVPGDLLELATARALPLPGTQLVFHLAAAVSGECEADFDLGMRSNLDATRALLEACRALGNNASSTGTSPGGTSPSGTSADKDRLTFVFASSLAVFGNPPGRPLPDPIEDETLPTPQSSYGIQKFICEQLVADYTRKGFFAGRSVRLMTVSVRAGQPNGAASGFLSGMIREPLAGVKAACPVPAETPVALASPARTVEGLIRAAEVGDAQWGPLTGLNLPSLRTTVGRMAAALEQVAGPAAAALLDWTPDEAVRRLVKTWPGNVAWDRARALGLSADADFVSVVRDYIRENPKAVTLKINA